MEMVEVAQLEHLGGEGIGRDRVCELVGLAYEGADLAPGVGAEVAAHPLAQVGGLAHVEDLTVSIEEAVHARCPRQVVGELQLRRLGVAAHRRQGDEVVETHHAHACRPLEHEVQEIGGGEGVVEGAMVGAVVEAETAGECAQAAVGYFVAHKAPGESQGVDDRVGEGLAVAAA